MGLSSVQPSRFLHESGQGVEHGLFPRLVRIVFRLIRGRGREGTMAEMILRAWCLLPGCQASDVRVVSQVTSGLSRGWKGALEGGAGSWTLLLVLLKLTGARPAGNLDPSQRSKPPECFPQPAPARLGMQGCCRRFSGGSGCALHFVAFCRSRFSSGGRDHMVILHLPLLARFR